MALLIGSALILYSFVIGEPGSPGSPASGAQKAKGGSGDGDVRGNVFGDNATINISRKAPSPILAPRKNLIQQTPSELLEIFREHTQIQAEKLVEPYIGGWLEVNGTVHDVSLTDSSGHRVSLDIEDVSQLLFLYFPEHTQEHLPRLRRGDDLHVIGRISNIESLWLGLEDCEFVD